MPRTGAPSIHTDERIAEECRTLVHATTAAGVHADHPGLHVGVVHLVARRDVAQGLLPEPVLLRVTAEGQAELEDGVGRAHQHLRLRDGAPSRSVR